LNATADRQRAAIRRWLGWILVATLCIAALTAIVAILEGELSEDDARVIGASLGFGIFSALAAPGATLRLRASERLRAVGLVTLLLAAASYVLLLAALFTGNDDEDTWRLFGIFGLGSLFASHASLVVGAMRDTDSVAVLAIAIGSIVLSAVDSGIGILAITGAFDDVDDPEGLVRFTAVLVVLMLLTTVLPPIMRRLQAKPAVRSAEPSRAGASAEPSQGPGPLAEEVMAAVDRIEALNADPGNNAPMIRRECERLRELARTHSH
jgi:FtsH-binding integral membrane protein